MEARPSNARERGADMGIRRVAPIGIWILLLVASATPVAAQGNEGTIATHSEWAMAAASIPKSWLQALRVAGMKLSRDRATGSKRKVTRSSMVIRTRFLSCLAHHTTTKVLISSVANS